MKYYQSIALSIFFWVFAMIANISAQGTVSGRVIDARLEPIAFANVMLLNVADSSLVRGAITDEAGQFALDVETGKSYLLAASFIGFQINYTEPFILDRPNTLKLPDLTLQENTAELETVTVVAEKPLFEQQIDRTVINVRESVTSAGGTALEILEKSPGVVVDQGNNVLSLLGKQGVIIMINGKRNRMDQASVIQMLSAMPADNIEKIELITTPPANYDAEGDAGIINIQLRRNTGDGFNGNYGLNTAYGLRPKWGGHLNVNLRQGAWNVYGEASTSWRYLQQDADYGRSLTQNGQLVETEGNSYRPAFQGLHRGQIGLDYQPNDRTIIGALLSGYTSIWTLDARTNSRNLVEGELEEEQVLRSDELNRWDHWMANFNLRQQLREAETLTFDFDYLYYVDDNPTDYLNEVFDAQKNLTGTQSIRSRKATPINFWVARLDYERQWNERLRFSAGLKGTWSSFINDISVEYLEGSEWVIEPLFTARYDLQERIGAGYVSSDLQLSPKTTIKAGLRYELTVSNLGTETIPDIVDRTYGRWFPSFFVTHDISDQQRIGASFSQRITRPSFNVIAPALFFWGPNTLLAGNPSVQPTITSTSKLEYRFRTMLLTLQYSYDELPIVWGQPTVDVASNQLVNRSTNMKDRHTAMFSLSFPIQFTSWWNSRYNFAAFWQRQRPVYEEIIVTRDDRYYTANLSQQFQLGNQWQTELSGRVNSARAYGFGKIPVRGAINLGLQKQWGSSRVSLNWTDIFKTGNFFEINYNDPALEFQSSWLYHWEGSIVRLSYTYDFGREQVRQKRQRATGSETERSRVQ